MNKSLYTIIACEGSNHAPQVRHLLMQAWAKSSSIEMYLFWHLSFNHSLYHVQLRDFENRQS